MKKEVFLPWYLFAAVGLFAVAFMFACKKPEPITYVISGRITATGSNMAVAGAEVAIQANVITGGIYNGKEEVLATTTADVSGFYRLQFNKGVAENFKLRVAKGNYLTALLAIDEDQLSRNKQLEMNAPLNGLGEVEIRIKNVQFNLDTNAQFSYGYRGEEMPCECCSRQPFTARGQVDTLLSCKVFSERFYRYRYTVVRSGFPIEVVDDSVFVRTAEKARVNIEY
ncbi:MAG TPA: hypothetical protein VFV37_08260 [Luteibaculaceae bacterium]|nr:hypothetical protein [Luteibaculaceae bacterium]